MGAVLDKPQAQCELPSSEPGDIWDSLWLGFVVLTLVTLICFTVFGAIKLANWIAGSIF